MIRVHAMSGELLASLEVAELQGKTVKCLKTCLAAKLRRPRFRQRLLYDAMELADDEGLRPMTLQLVLVRPRSPDAKQKQELLEVCQANDLERLECLLSQALDPNIREELCNWTPLHRVAWSGSLESAALLLEATADVNQVAEGAVGAGAVPLHLAAEQGHVEVVRLLLAAGANIDPITNDASTPLILAAWFGHADVVGSLLKAGANKDQATNLGASALLFAVQQNQLEVVRLLLEAGANQDTSEKLGFGPRQVAALCRHFEVARLLKEALA